MNRQGLLQKYPKLYQDLTEYYPIVADKDVGEDYNPAIFDKLNRSIDLKIGDRKYFQNFWSRGVLKKVEKETNYKVQDLTLGAVPNYGGMIRLSNPEHGKVASIIEIQFYVSLINNYISINILEMEESIVVHPIMHQDIIEQNLLKLVVSPSPHKYNYVFERIENILDETFDNAKFLSYGLEKTVIDGLRIPHTYKANVTLGESLFSKKIPFNDGFEIIGDQDYRITDIQ